jgi:hypothetical protein
MNFNLEKSIEILERTPPVLERMLSGVSHSWTSTNEGPDTWSVYDVIGHLIHGELTDWMPRAEIILAGNDKERFKSFDRFAQFQESMGKSLQELLNEFAVLRKKNIGALRSKNITVRDLERKGIHPDFGEVTLAQLLATWVVHDLNHIAQICRVMAKQYNHDVGPWKAYLGILKY